MLKNNFEKINQMKCTVCFFVKGKDVLLGPKWRTPKLFGRLNYKSKCENNIRVMSWALSLTHNTSKLEGRVAALG
jgi:hypothetical protein